MGIFKSLSRILRKIRLFVLKQFKKKNQVRRGVLQLSDQIPLPDVEANQAYLLLSDYGDSVLAARKFRSDVKYFDAYSLSWNKGNALENTDVQQVYFTPLVNGKFQLYIKSKSDESFYLQPDNNDSTYNWLYWGNIGNYPVLDFKFVNDEMYTEIKYEEDDKVKFVDMGFCVNKPDTKRGGAFISSKGSDLDNQIFQPKVYKLLIKQADMLELLKQEWPDSTFDHCTVRQGDDYFEVLTESKAKSIWEDSGLNDYKYKESIFDCDDFALCYKAQAAKASYNNPNPSGAYAVGVIWGDPPVKGDCGHAVNVFVDFDGSIKILEPQNGTVIEGKDWKYKPIFVIF